MKSSLGEVQSGIVVLIVLGGILGLGIQVLVVDYLLLGLVDFCAGLELLHGENVARVVWWLFEKRLPAVARRYRNVLHLVLHICSLRDSNLRDLVDIHRIGGLRLHEVPEIAIVRDISCRTFLNP